MEGKKHKSMVRPHIAEILSNYSQEDSITIEIGCGGTPYKAFIKGTYHGTDITNKLYEGEGPDVLCRGEVLPFRESSVDLVFAINVLLLIPDTNKVFKEAYRVLKPRGKFLTFNYGWHTARRLQKAASGHNHSFTSLSLWYLYVRNGFKPKRIFYYLPSSGTRPGRLLSKFRGG